jgi:hypothetical protein
MALAPHDRPFVTRLYRTDELPDTPQRDYRIPARGWIEAPEELVALGEPIGEPVEYKRRIGRWLLWRAGPAVGEARYLAVSTDASRSLHFDLHGRTGRGVGPHGETHTRFRSWKEALLADPGGAP